MDQRLKVVEMDVSKHFEVGKIVVFEVEKMVVIDLDIANKVDFLVVVVAVVDVWEEIEIEWHNEYCYYCY
jgi:hypothetical protein